MRKRIILLWIILCLICLAACGHQETDEEIAERIAGKIYVYKNEGSGGGEFTICLGEDGVYTYDEGPLSSYMGRGSWSIWMGSQAISCILTPMTGTDSGRLLWKKFGFLSSL